jgi:hypothetical protein
MTAIVREMMRLLSIRPPFVFQLAPPIGEHSGDCYMFRGEVPLPGGRYSQSAGRWQLAVGRQA